jgi:hypothetical protein
MSDAPLHQADDSLSPIEPDDDLLAVSGPASQFDDAVSLLGDHGHAAPVCGMPEADTAFWQPQTTGFTCAVMAQRGIIAEFTGQDISEAQLVYDATAHGWLTDGGMSPLDADKLLELYHIPCHSQTGARIEDLMAELAQGHKVIVGVDSGEIWGQDHPLEDFFGQAADHAIWVTGVDLSDPAHPQVIVNDSGDPNGAGKVYGLDQFVDAWQDSGFFYVSTDHAPPDMGGTPDFDPSQGLFPALVDYFSGFDADFHERVGADPPAGASGARLEAGREPKDAARLGAGVCAHCGGQGYTTWPGGARASHCCQ